MKDNYILSNGVSMRRPVGYSIDIKNWNNYEESNQETFTLKSSSLMLKSEDTENESKDTEILQITLRKGNNFKKVSKRSGINGKFSISRQSSNFVWKKWNFKLKSHKSEICDFTRSRHCLVKKFFI